MQTIKIVPGTLAHKVYGQTEVVEAFRCNYGVNPVYADKLSAGELKVAGTDANGEVRIVELPAHRFFLATLFLPQLSSRAAAPHPLIVGYLRSALAFQDSVHAPVGHNER